jgi:HAD superfamily hydrolase (TIGR01458 family)
MKAILFDLDGVIYEGERAIPGAAQALEQIVRRGIPHLFLTNTTSRPRSVLRQKLASFGVAAREEQILTPASAAAEWLRGQPRTAIAAFVQEPVLAEFADLELATEGSSMPVSHVVVGDLEAAWCFEELNRAFRLLHATPTAKLVALGMTRFWKSPEGPRLDVGPFIKALEYASDRSAIVTGKPAPAFFQAALSKLGVKAEEALMIGDDILTDIGAAQSLGIRGALVRTGKFRPADLERGIKPDYVLGSVVELPALFGA